LQPHRGVGRARGATAQRTQAHSATLHHIGIGRTHARTHILILVQDLDVRVINAAPANCCAS
jgi:hypothetical protein